MMFTRNLYGFKSSAKIKAWLLRRRGYKTKIQHEYVKPDGATLCILHKELKWYNLAPYWAGWPDLKIAWVVYHKKEGED